MRASDGDDVSVVQYIFGKPLWPGGIAVLVVELYSAARAAVRTNGIVGQLWRKRRGVLQGSATGFLVVMQAFSAWLRAEYPDGGVSLSDSVTLHDQFFADDTALWNPNVPVAATKMRSIVTTYAAGTNGKVNAGKTYCMIVGECTDELVASVRAEGWQVVNNNPEAIYLGYPLGMGYQDQEAWEGAAAKATVAQSVVPALYTSGGPHALCPGCGTTMCLV